MPSPHNLDDSGQKTVSERYDMLVATGSIERNEAQHHVVSALDALASRIEQYDHKQSHLGLSIVPGRVALAPRMHQRASIFWRSGTGQNDAVGLIV
jgi:predicted ATPase